MQYAQKLSLLKQVNKHALSSDRIKAMTVWMKTNTINKEDLNEISDFIWLRVETINEIARNLK